MNLKRFSMIELLVVIAVLMVLATLSLTGIKSVYQSARTVICQNNLKMMGQLSFAYANDNESVLPGESTDDIKAKQSSILYSGLGLYSNWNGHLLPYLNSDVKDYNRDAKLASNGVVYAGSSSSPSNPYHLGYIYIKEAFENGGYGDLKSMICPEAFYTSDAFTQMEYQMDVPRIMGITNHSFSKGSGYNVRSGMPTSYLANNVLYGAENNEPIKFDTVKNFSQKVLLIEGAAPTSTFADWSHYSFYFDATWATAHTDLVFGGERHNPIGNLKYVRQSYFHGERVNEFYAPSTVTYTNRQNYPIFFVDAFNKQFLPKAFMANCFNKSTPKDIDRPLVTMISKDTPKILEQQDVIDFFKSYNQPLPDISFKYFDDRNYAVGECNMLFGDGSVKQKHQSDLYNHTDFYAR